MTIIGDLTRGGLGMVDVNSKVLSLKASWVKRLLENDSGNIHILNTYLYKYGINFKYLLKGYFIKLKEINHIKIPLFYKHIIMAYHQCKIKENMNNTNTILSQPLWCNTNVVKDKNNTAQIYQNWSRSRILYVADCINIDGTFFTEQQCLQKLLYQTNWMIEYLYVKRVVAKLIKNHDVSNAIYINNHEMFHKQIVTTFGIYNIESIQAKNYYQFLFSKKFVVPILQVRWNNILNACMLESDWAEIYNSKVIGVPDAKLAQFNFKLLHNIVVCRNDLFKWKKIQSAACMYCGHVETTKHIYFECTYVNIMWTKLGIILKMGIKWQHLVLGVRGDNITVMFRNMLFTVIMFSLYRNWCKNIDLNKKYTVDEINILNCRSIILKDLYSWNSILNCVKHDICKIKKRWNEVIHNIITFYDFI